MQPSRLPGDACPNVMYDIPVNCDGDIAQSSLLVSDKDDSSSTAEESVMIPEHGVSGTVSGTLSFALHRIVLAMDSPFRLNFQSHTRTCGEGTEDLWTRASDAVETITQGQAFHEPPESSVAGLTVLAQSKSSAPSTESASSPYIEGSFLEKVTEWRARMEQLHIADDTDQDIDTKQNFYSAATAHFIDRYHSSLSPSSSMPSLQSVTESETGEDWSDVSDSGYGSEIDPEMPELEPIA
ncbi:unnamed protein product [Peniophora sp. CBMAI 1063]|nr:unnamed protein product [Peniophora sp. CBMAI 1063]